MLMNTNVKRNKNKFRIGLPVFNRTFGIGRIVGEDFKEGNYYWSVEFKDDNDELSRVLLAECNLYPVRSRCYKCNKKHDIEKETDFRITALSRECICKSCITKIQDLLI